jgi:geranylgeranyl diphosphate synthase type I
MCSIVYLESGHILAFNSFLTTIARDVDNYVLDRVRGEPAELYRAALHIYKAGGKRLRPALVVITGLMLGGEYEKLIPYGGAVELIHTFTLIHDDIMDNDDYRRGVPTVHRLWGVPTAIIAGDLLFSKSFELASSAGSVDHSRIVRAVHELAVASTTVAEGQMMDMSF